MWSFNLPSKRESETKWFWRARFVFSSSDAPFSVSLWSSALIGYFLVSVGLCGTAGFYREFTKPIWIDAILQWQRSNGCFGNASTFLTELQTLGQYVSHNWEWYIIEIAFPTLYLSWHAPCGVDMAQTCINTQVIKWCEMSRHWKESQTSWLYMNLLTNGSYISTLDEHRVYFTFSLICFCSAGFDARQSVWSIALDVIDVLVCRPLSCDITSVSQRGTVSLSISDDSKRFRRSNSHKTRRQKREERIMRDNCLSHRSAVGLLALMANLKGLATWCHNGGGHTALSWT